MAAANGPRVKITAPVNGSTTATDAFIPEFTVTSPTGAAITSTQCRVYRFQFLESANATVEEFVNAGDCNSGELAGTYDSGRPYRLKLVATDANGDVGVDTVDFTPGLRVPWAPEIINDVMFGALTDRTPTFKLLYSDTLYPTASIECAMTREGETPVFAQCGTSTNLPSSSPRRSP